MEEEEGGRGCMERVEAEESKWERVGGRGSVQGKRM